MPVSSRYQIVLSSGEEAVLAARARSVRGPYRDRLRAAIVLAAAAGRANAVIAAELRVCTDTVRKWRRRFATGRLAGLTDAPRSGRPPSFTAADRAEVIALACALPAESGVPLARWSGPDLARELAARCQITVSASTIGRWLDGDALKPWQHRSWMPWGVSFGDHGRVLKPRDAADEGFGELADPGEDRLGDELLAGSGGSDLSLPLRESSLPDHMLMGFRATFAAMCPRKIPARYGSLAPGWISDYASRQIRAMLICRSVSALTSDSALWEPLESWFIGSAHRRHSVCSSCSIFCSACFAPAAPQYGAS
jgi:transposase